MIFGLGFCGANLKVAYDLVRFRRRRDHALLVWKGEKPRFYGLSLGIGVVLGVLLVFRVVVQHRPMSQLFGEIMMFLYYGYAFPLSQRIERGVYEDGIWSDGGFLSWTQISALSWREGDRITLLIVSRLRAVARRLDVPGHLYGQVRRLLRDRVQAHDIHFGGMGLDLGSREEQDAV